MLILGHTMTSMGWEELPWTFLATPQWLPGEEQEPTPATICWSVFSNSQGWFLQASGRDYQEEIKKQTPTLPWLHSAPSINVKFLLILMRKAPRFGIGEKRHVSPTHPPFPTLYTHSTCVLPAIPLHNQSFSQIKNTVSFTIPALIEKTCAKALASSTWQVNEILFTG